MADLNPRLLDLVRGFEDMRLKAYRCPGGVWTISAGVTRYEDGSPVREGDTVTPERAEALFRATLGGVRDLVVGKLPDQPDHVVDACASLAYNIGIGAFTGSTCLRRLRAGDLPGAAAALQWWNKAGGKVLGGLVARRKIEADILEHGWDGSAGPAVAVGEVEESPPQLSRSRTIWGAVTALIGGLTMCADQLPALWSQASQAHDALAARGVDERVAIAAAALVLIGAAVVVYAKRDDERSGRVAPR